MQCKSTKMAVPRKRHNTLTHSGLTLRSLLRAQRTEDPAGDRQVGDYIMQAKLLLRIYAVEMEVSRTKNIKFVLTINCWLQKLSSLLQLSLCSLLNTAILLLGFDGNKDSNCPIPTCDNLLDYIKFNTVLDHRA